MSLLYPTINKYLAASRTRRHMFAFDSETVFESLLTSTPPWTANMVSKRETFSPHGAVARLQSFLPLQLDELFLATLFPLVCQSFDVVVYRLAGYAKNAA